jgi:hypothetical protein
MSEALSAFSIVVRIFIWRGEAEALFDAERN